MIGRLHRELASLNFRHTLRWINARHWFDGFPMNVNDNGVI